MSENKHTPEPMFQYQFRQLATYENGRTPVLLTEAQYCRAKSCIDACAGMTSEQVSHGIVSASVFSSVVQQRDELLAEFAAYKEGSEEAFGAVVAQKQAAEARLQTMQSTIASQQGVICDFRRQRDELLAALDITLAQHDALLRDFGLCSADTIEQARAVLARVKGEQ